MGQCFSRPDQQGNNNPYQDHGSQGGGNGTNDGDPHASTRPINSSQPQIRHRPTTATSAQSLRRNDSGAEALTTRTSNVNRPIVLPKPWTSKDRVWTREQLDRERTIYFETQTQGNIISWETLHQVCEMLWNGGDMGEEDGGLGTAQAILDAAEITVPKGHLTLCYDNRGYKYQMPLYIISDPTNLAPPEPKAEPMREEETSLNGDNLESPSSSVLASTDQQPITPLTEEQAQIRREAKGKAKSEPIIIVVQRNDLIGRSKINVDKKDSCRVIARKIEEQTNVPSTMKVKLYFGGFLLEESLGLHQRGWTEGAIISAWVFETDPDAWKKPKTNSAVEVNDSLGKEEGRADELENKHVEEASMSEVQREQDGFMPTGAKAEETLTIEEQEEKNANKQENKKVEETSKDKVAREGKQIV